MKDVLIIGGGLAGLTSAIHLSQAGLKVVLIEKKDYPRNKVCGEYISNEVLAYLQSLGVNPFELNSKKITHFQLSASSGKFIQEPLDLGGFSVRRYTLDNHLYQHALKSGVEVLLNTTIQNIEFKNDFFEASSNKSEIFKAKVVIAAHGKRSSIDKTLNRPFFQDRAYYIGVKQYFQMPFPDNLVALHNFEGGYCGVSKVENDWVNVAYLTTKQSLQKYGTIETLQQNALGKNPFLKEIFEKGKPIFDKPLVISNVSFQSKKRVCNRILMCGDAAGMISPLCGNGMAMAIHSANIVSGLILNFLEGKISRAAMELQYERQWNHLFKNRLFWGKHLQRFMGHSLVSEFSVQGLKLFPFLLKPIMKQTHGNNY
ncbi:MAG: NAD(P)/FAD-dependent oxidoreductase [Chitinophagales bacterium]